MYRSLDPDKIVATLEQLERRITERFPQAGLCKVCNELTGIARASRAKSTELKRPHLLLRGLSALVIVLGVGLIAELATLLRIGDMTASVYEILQGVDAAFNVAVLSGAALLFLVTLEGRWKRGQALGNLNELRSIIHVIDMHQLTKDPSATDQPFDTPSSPRRDLDPFALTRYLDYCSEMLSLSAKVAALYAQSTNDPVVIAASSDLQQITSNLSNKIWQKINIIQTMHPNEHPRASPVAVQPASADALPARAAATALAKPSSQLSP